jgi:hypothetical protein
MSTLLGHRCHPENKRDLKQRMMILGMLFYTHEEKKHQQ